MKIIIRPFDPKLDSGLIYDSYPKGVYYGVESPWDKPKAQWFKEFHTFLQQQLERASVYVACPYEDPITMLGYSIIDDGTLFFVYVKERFRNQGIGTLLTKNRFSKVNESTLTRVGLAVLSKHSEKLKGKPNEE